MPHVTRPDRRDIFRSVLYLAIYILVIGVSAFFLLVDYWYIWLLIVLAGLFNLVNWHRQKTAYLCPNCGHLYEISFLTDLLSPHGFNRQGAWLWLSCPDCHVRSKTPVIKKVGKE
jgi:hypothetical protein